VEGRVLNPETVVLPIGPKVSFAVLRVYVYPQGKPVQLWNQTLPRKQLLLETKKGTVELAPPTWGGWRKHPGVLWSSGPVWKTYETLEGLPAVSGIPGWREAETSRGFSVLYWTLLQGDHVVVEDPQTENAQLWRGTIASIQAGHRFAAKVAGGTLLVFSMGIGWATVLFTRGRWAQHG
jgi:hypothetical protein